MFHTNARRTSPQRANPAAQRAEIQRLSKEFGLEAFLNPQVPANPSEPVNPFAPPPSNTPAQAQAPVVVVVKRRRALAVPA